MSEISELKQLIISGFKALGLEVMVVNTGHESNPVRKSYAYRVNKKPKQTRKASERVYTESFEQAWKLKPSRKPHSNSKVAAFRAWNARIPINGGFPHDGVDAKWKKDIIEGIKRYAAYVKHEGIEPRYVMQLSTFLGPSQHFLEAWEIVDKPKEKIKLPYLNEELQAFATEHGIRLANPNESYPQYRKYIQSQIDKINEDQ